MRLVRLFCCWIKQEGRKNCFLNVFLKCFIPRWDFGKFYGLHLPCVLALYSTAKKSFCSKRCVFSHLSATKNTLVTTKALALTCMLSILYVLVNTCSQREVGNIKQLQSWSPAVSKPLLGFSSSWKPMVFLSSFLELSQMYFSPSPEYYSRMRGKGIRFKTKVLLLLPFTFLWIKALWSFKF